MVKRLHWLHFLLFFIPVIAQTQDAIKTDKFIVEPSTLTNLGFEWHISGDDNRNASVQVSYHIPGTSNWEQALPLMRAGGERIFRKPEFLDYNVPDYFAGSILDLHPDIDTGRNVDAGAELLGLGGVGIDVLEPGPLRRTEREQGGDDLAQPSGSRAPAPEGRHARREVLDRHAGGHAEPPEPGGRSAGTERGDDGDDAGW